MSITTEVAIESFGTRRRWRMGAALSGLLLVSLATLAFAANSFSVRAQPLSAAGGPSSGAPSSVPGAARLPDVIDVSTLPLEQATTAPAPSPHAAATPPARVQDHTAKTTRTLRPRASRSGHAAGRGPRAPQPKNAELAVSDFGGRR